MRVFACDFLSHVHQGVASCSRSFGWPRVVYSGPFGKSRVSFYYVVVLLGNKGLLNLELTTA